MNKRSEQRGKDKKQAFGLAFQLSGRQRLREALCPVQCVVSALRTAADRAGSLPKDMVVAAQLCGLQDPMKTVR